MMRFNYQKKKKIEDWLNEEENNLIEFKRLKKQQELAFKKMNDNIQVKNK